MKTIPLTQGKVAFVSDGDFECVNQFKWYANLSRNRWYAMRSVTLRSRKEARETGLPLTTSQLMHRFIMGLELGDPLEVDHIDREQTLDNRRSNLRVTLDQNQQNTSKQKNNTSGYKGVSWHKFSGKWRAQISHRDKLIHGGLFDCPVAAAAFYNWMALQFHDEFAVLNDLSNVTVADLGKKAQFAEMGVAA